MMFAVPQCGRQNHCQAYMFEQQSPEGQETLQARDAMWHGCRIKIMNGPDEMWCLQYHTKGRTVVHKLVL